MRLRREDDGLVGTDDGVNILEEDDHGITGCEKRGLLSFVMMLAEIAGGVKEILRDDRGLQPNVFTL